MFLPPAAVFYYGGSARAPAAPRATRASDAAAPAASAWRLDLQLAGPTQPSSARGCKRPSSCSLSERVWIISLQKPDSTDVGSESSRLQSGFVREHVWCRSTTAFQPSEPSGSRRSQWQSGGRRTPCVLPVPCLTDSDASTYCPKSSRVSSQPRSASWQ